jgi:hypothetical protein
MLAFIQYSGRVSDRKMRLFGLACCRRIPTLFPDAASQAALLTAERFADGQATLDGVLSVLRRVAGGPEELGPNCLALTPLWRVMTFVLGRIESIRCLVDYLLQHLHQQANDRQAVLRAAAGEEIRAARESWAKAEAAVRKERMEQCHLLRDLFPYPVRPGMPAIISSDVASLAQAAYEERALPSGELDPARLAVLADALEEAGADATLLEHLRGPGPHVRGCHVVDLLTGME